MHYISVLRKSEFQLNFTSNCMKGKKI